MKIKVCVVQDSPVFFDKDQTIEKVANLVSKYSGQGAQLIVFPESFIPGYPRGFTFGATIGKRTHEGRALYAKYYNNSVDLESEDLKKLTGISKNNNVYLVMGVTEKQSNNGSLYCSTLYISPTNGLLGVHRKIKPTGTERLVWAESSGKDLVTLETPLGKIGGLICWENYMPLARMAMYNKGVQLYMATTADSRDSWVSTMVHIALEGRCFVLGCNQYFTKSMYPEEYREFVKDDDEVICRGASVIVSPMGKILAGPLIGEAGALMAEPDLEEITRSKLDMDVAGHYARPDIFKFEVRDQPEMMKEK